MIIAVCVGEHGAIDANIGGDACYEQMRDAPAAQREVQGRSTAGEYVVWCVVTDMKGGRGSSRLLVRVGSPSTYRVSGRVMAEGVPLEGVRVYVSSSQLCGAMTVA
jgi:hypothetical protein